MNIDCSVDLTSQPEVSTVADADAARTPPLAETDDDQLIDQERGLARLPSVSASEEPPMPFNVTSAIRKRTSSLFQSTSEGSTPFPPFLADLVAAYEESDLAKHLDGQVGTRDVGSDVRPRSEIRGRKPASLWTQFRILSGRAFKNLYRDPALLATHYIAAFVLALVAGGLFHNVTSVFLRLTAYVTLTCASGTISAASRIGSASSSSRWLSSDSRACPVWACFIPSGCCTCASGRPFFLRLCVSRLTIVRANGYYSSFTYFSSKVLFDILPLRVVPPFVFAAIAYPLIGLVGSSTAYWKFMLTLVLFNLTTASVCLLLSVAFESLALASFVGTLVMLFKYAALRRSELCGS
jgi:hypothetical protein